MPSGGVDSGVLFLHGRKGMSSSSPSEVRESDSESIRKVRVSSMRVKPSWRRFSRTGLISDLVVFTSGVWMSLR